jgi:hypothetical protein
MLVVTAADATPGRASALFELAHEIGTSLEAIVGVARHVEAQRQQRLLDEARGCRLQPQEAAHHQVRSHQQRERQPHLSHDQQRLQPLRGRAGGAARAVAQIGHEIGARRAPGGEQTAQERRQRGHEHDERCPPPVEVEAHPVRQLLRPRRDRQLDEPAAERQPEQASGRTEQDALREHLAGEAATARAQRGAHRELALARDAARERQVREVRAADQQHADHGAEQDERHRARALVHRRVAEAERTHAPATVGVGVLIREGLRDAVDLGLQLL